MKDTEKIIDEAIASSAAAIANTGVENIIFTFNCRFSLDRVSFSDFEGFSDHAYQLSAELFRDTVKVSYLCGQFNEAIPSIRYEAIVGRNFMKQLDEIINASDVRRYNGMHRITAGLPEGYGCALEVRYAYGPPISLSNNSFLYFTVDFMQQLIDLFRDASGATEDENSGRLNGVAYSQYENGLNILQAYILADPSGFVSLEYYDRKNFLTRRGYVSAALFKELQQVYDENDLKYPGTGDDRREGLKTVLVTRFGRLCRSVSSDDGLTDLQLTALEEIRGIIERYLAAMI